MIQDPCICTTCPIRCNLCGVEPIASRCPVPGALMLKTPTPDKLAKLAVIHELTDLDIAE